MSGNLGREAWQGWKKSQGWMRSEGLSDDGDVGTTLVEGLLRSRESLLVAQSPADTEPAVTPTPAARSASPAPEADGLPPLDAADELDSCSPDARARQLIVELLEGLVVRPDVGTAAATVSVSRGSHRYEVVRLVRPGREAFKAQTVMVENWAVRRSERAPEILSQRGPHLPYWASLLDLSADRTPKTLELCNVAMDFAAFVVQRLKHILACPRPVAYSKRVQPMIVTPGFSAFPSGHGTEAFMLARLLARLCGLEAGDADLLQRQAERIATNRVVAGLHFPVDNMAGRLLGHTLAEYFEHRCIGTGWVARSFDGTKVGHAVEFKREPMSPGAMPKESVDLAPYFAGNTDERLAPGTPSQNLAWLWDRCRSGSA